MTAEVRTGHESDSQEITYFDRDSVNFLQVKMASGMMLYSRRTN